MAVNNSDIVAFIFARGGSKGLPGKNIRPFAGKPLIAWSIEQAKAVSRISRVLISTDSEEIASVAHDYGAEVPFIRPAPLATDDSPEWLSWQHAMEYLSRTEGQLPSAMVAVPTTAPLRIPADIEACLDLYLKGGADTVITVTEAHRNPYFNMVRLNHDDTVEVAIAPTAEIRRRQDAPKIFDITTIAYVVDPQFLLIHSGIFSGRVKAAQVPIERGIDIDTLLDFQIAEFIFHSRSSK